MKHDTNKRVVTTQSDRQLATFSMRTDGVCDRLADARDQPRVLEYADWRVSSGLNSFELVMAIEVDLPTKFLELFDKPSLDEMNGAFIDA